MYKLLNLMGLSAICFVIWIIYIANTGGHSVFFDIVRTTRDGDKIGHFFLYGLLAFCLNVSWRLRTLRWHKFNLYWGTLGVSVFVVLEELSQAYIPSRTVDARDLYADAAGIFCFTVLTALVHLLIYFIRQRLPRHEANGQVH